MERHPDSPIPTTADWPYPVNSALNTSAIMLENGDTRPDEVFGRDRPRIYEPASLALSRDSSSGTETLATLHL